MTAALARVVPPENPKGVCCSTCGEIIHASPDMRAGALLELSCTRCGTSDIYHSNSLVAVELLRRSGGRSTTP